MTTTAQDNPVLEYLEIQKRLWENAQIVAHQWVPLSECEEYGRPIIGLGDGAKLIFPTRDDWSAIQYIADRKEMLGLPRFYPKARDPFDAMVKLHAEIAREAERLELKLTLSNAEAWRGADNDQTQELK